MKKTKILSNLKETVVELEPKPIPVASNTAAELLTMRLYQKKSWKISLISGERWVGGITLEAFSRWTE